MPARREPADELRRRLYRSGATDEDLRRYLDARPDPSIEPARPTAPARRSRTVRRAGVAVLAALAVVVVALAASGPGRPAPVAARTPSIAALRDVGGGRLLDVGRGRTSAAAAVVTAVGSTPVLGRRVEGRGSAVVALDPASGVVDGGRSVVALAADGSARVRWSALLEVLHPDGSTSVFVLARGRAATPSGAGGATTFDWPTRPPTSIAVFAPDDVRWALVCASVDGPPSASR